MAGEVLHAILKWIGSGKDCGVRRPRKRNLRNRPLEDNSIVGQRVEGWRFDLLRAITAKVVGAQRVHGDENHVGTR